MKQNMLFTAFRAALVAGSITGAGAAFAQDARWYVGGALGQAAFRDACSDATVPCDEKDRSWKLFGGYQFHRNFGAEIGYVDFGKAKASGTDSGFAVDGTLKATAWELVGVGTWPIVDKVSLYGKAGLYRAKSEASATASRGAFNVSDAASDNNTGFTLGIGGMYDITKTVGVRAEWQRYNGVGGDSTGGDNDIDVLSVGVVVRF